MSKGDKPNRQYTQIGNQVIVTELKEDYVSKTFSIDQLKRRRQQLLDIIDNARDEIQEINEMLKGTK